MGIWYHVAEPNSYLVITGIGIDKVLIKKKVSFPPTHPHSQSTQYLCWEAYSKKTAKSKKKETLPAKRIEPPPNPCRPTTYSRPLACRPHRIDVLNARRPRRLSLSGLGGCSIPHLAILPRRGTCFVSERISDCIIFIRGVVVRTLLIYVSFSRLSCTPSKRCQRSASRHLTSACLYKL
jgi:hypothetical protein